MHHIYFELNWLYNSYNFATSSSWSRLFIFCVLSDTVGWCSGKRCNMVPYELLCFFWLFVVRCVTLLIGFNNTCYIVFLNKISLKIPIHSNMLKRTFGMGTLIEYSLFFQEILVCHFFLARYICSTSRLCWYSTYWTHNILYFRISINFIIFSTNYILFSKNYVLFSKNYILFSTNYIQKQVFDVSV